MNKLIGPALMAAVVAFAGCGGGDSKQTETVNARGYSTSGTQLSKDGYKAKIEGELAQLKTLGGKLKSIKSDTPVNDARKVIDEFRQQANEVSSLNPPAQYQADNAALAAYLRKSADTLDKLLDVRNDKTKAPAATQDVIAAQQEGIRIRLKLGQELGLPQG